MRVLYGNAAFSQSSVTSQFSIPFTPTTTQTEDWDASTDSIIHKVCDFVSDVWDSNALEEYERIRSFEERAVQAFTEGGDDEEFSIEQKVLSPQCLREVYAYKLSLMPLPFVS